MKTPDQFAILKDIKIPVLIAVIAFLGGIAGSILGALLTAKHEEQKNISELRVTAYNKFFAGQAKFLQSRYGKEEEDKKRLFLEYQREIKEARFHIGVFGSSGVIQALVSWFKIVEPISPERDSRWKDDIKTYQAMRREILGENEALKVDDDVLHDLLFRYEDEQPSGQ